MDDEIEINGIKYVRKQEPRLYDAVPSHGHGDEAYVYRCGAPGCTNVASEHSYIRNTVLNVGDDEPYDLVLFTCPDGHRNRLRI